MFLCRFHFQFIYNSALRDDIPGILCGLAHDGDVNVIIDDDEGKCPLLGAIDHVSYDGLLCGAVSSDTVIDPELLPTTSLTRWEWSFYFRMVPN